MRSVDVFSLPSVDVSPIRAADVSPVRGSERDFSVACLQPACGCVFREFPVLCYAVRIVRATLSHRFPVPAKIAHRRARLQLIFIPHRAHGANAHFGRVQILACSDTCGAVKSRHV